MLRSSPTHIFKGDGLARDEPSEHERLRALAGEDAELHWAMRRKLYKELTRTSFRSGKRRVRSSSVRRRFGTRGLYGLRA